MDNVQKNDRRTYAVAQAAYSTHDNNPHISMLRSTVWDILRYSSRGEFTAARSIETLEGLTSAETDWVWREVIGATNTAAKMRRNFGK